MKTQPIEFRTPVPRVKVPPHPVQPAMNDAEKSALKGRIRELLRAKNAVLVAHYYVDGDLQELAEETGGLIDQVGDVFDLATSGDINNQSSASAAKHAGADSLIDRSYDETTGTWTISFLREHTSDDGTRTMSMSRTYEVQYLDAQGHPQQFFVTEGDTAYSLNVAIIEGSGSLETPHLSAERANITGQFTATGVNTDVVTVNGSTGSASFPFVHTP